MTTTHDLRGRPRIAIISGVSEESLPALFAAANRPDGSIERALAEHANAPLSVTPPFGLMGTSDLAFSAELSEHTSIHVAVEGVSLLAARAVQDSRFVSAIVPREVDPSLRMIALPDASPNVRDKVNASAAALYDVYRTLLERCAERVVVRDRVPLSYARSTASELLVGLIPAATQTRVLLTASARAFASRCSKLLAHPLPEVVVIGRAMLDAARTSSPEIFVHDAAATAEPPPSKMRLGAKAEVGRALARLYIPPQEGSSATMVISQPVRLVRHDKDALERVVLALAYEGSDPSVHAFALLGSLRLAKEPPLLDLLDAVLKDRALGEMVPRGFEAATVTFEIMADASTTHDILRHRAHTAAIQRLTCRLGFQTPDDLLDFGLAEPFQDAMVAAQSVWNELDAEDPIMAEYAVPMGYRVRSLWTLDLRQLIHVIETHSAKTSPTRIRRIAQGLYRTAAAVMPWLRNVARVDLE